MWQAQLFMQRLERLDRKLVPKITRKSVNNKECFSHNLKDGFGHQTHYFMCLYCMSSRLSRHGGHLGFMYISVYQKKQYTFHTPHQSTTMGVENK